jgi:hypothetical protein
LILLQRRSLFLVFIHLFICIYIVWAAFPPNRRPAPFTPLHPSRTCTASSSILLKRKHKRD